jgi:hypothetical protein
MARFAAISSDQAYGITAEVWSVIHQAVGKTPNACVTLATLVP